MRIECIEQTERDDPEVGLWSLFRSASLQRPCDYGVARRREQIVLVCDVSVDRSCSGNKPLGKCTKRQSVLAVGIQQLNRRLNDLRS